MNHNTAICHSFNACSAHYDDAAIIQHEIGHRLFARLDYFKIRPQTILDLGCGTGLFSRLLKKRYPQALVVGLDLAQTMLTVAKKKQRFWHHRSSWINADMLHMPFREASFDLVFANQVIHWSSSSKAILAEIERVMRPQGCLLFSTLGPDTFKEIKQAFATADTYQHINSFEDMHDYGDTLLQQRFISPVVDMEYITLHYSSLKQLITGLKAQGVKNIHPQRNKALTGKAAWQKFENHYQRLCTPEGKYPLTYEVIYGQAFKNQMMNATEISIPLSSIQRALL